MTIEDMAVRLGINETELDTLKAQEKERKLPGGYAHLSDCIGSRLLQKQNSEWVQLMEKINEARRKAHTFEGTEELHNKLQVFVESL